MWHTLSRVAIVIGAIASDWILPDHLAEGVEQYDVQYSSEIMRILLSPFTKWDAVHYIKLASEGYTDEHQVAFFPLYPMLLKSGSSLLANLNINVQVGWTAHERVILAALVINFAAFIIAYQVLHRLLRYTVPSLPQKRISLATFLFCFNPAGIFFSTMYTEALFSALSWSGFYLYSQQYSLLSAVPFCLASLLRSNGSLNIVVVLLTWAARSWRDYNHSSRSGFTQLLCFLWSAVQLAVVCTAIVLPGFLYNIVHFQLLCGGEGHLNTSNSPPLAITQLARTLWDRLLPAALTLRTGSNTAQFCAANAQRVWWARSIVYPYIQEKYWNVGLFRYYQWRQVPNFLLAAPIVCIALYTVYHFDAVFGIGSEKVKNEDGGEAGVERKGGKTGTLMEQWQRRILHPAFPLVAHLCVTLAVGVLVANVQITTRLICASCPIIYVAMAHIAEQKQGKQQRMLWGYLVLYNVAGVLLHCNYYPWT
jgi:phosphatidylinositol glycan class V